MKSKKLVRIEKDKIVAGVCTGLGAYFDVDAVLVRIIFVILTLAGGAGILLYLGMVMVIPMDAGDDGILDGDEMLKESAPKKDPVQDFTNTYLQGDTSKLFAVILIAIGVFYFLSSAGLFAIFDLGRIWPIILIIVGIAILIRK